MSNILNNKYGFGSVLYFHSVNRNIYGYMCVIPQRFAHDIYWQPRINCVCVFQLYIVDAEICLLVRSVYNLMMRNTMNNVPKHRRASLQNNKKKVLSSLFHNFLLNCIFSMARITKIWLQFDKVLWEPWIRTRQTKTKIYRTLFTER